MTQLELYGEPHSTGPAIPCARGGISRGEALALIRGRRPGRVGQSFKRPNEKPLGTWTPRPYGGAVSSTQCESLLKLARKVRERNAED